MKYSKIWKTLNVNRAEIVILCAVMCVTEGMEMKWKTVIRNVEEIVDFPENITSPQHIRATFGRERCYLQNT